MTFIDQFVRCHHLALTPEEWRLCRQAASIMASSVDPFHDCSHISRMLDSLNEFMGTDEFRKIAGRVDLKTLLLAILWHDCWRAAKDVKRPLSLFWLTLYEGIGAGRYFANAARDAGIEKALRLKVSYAIRKHSRFQVLPIVTLEAKILRMVDALDMFNPDRANLLKKRFLFEQPIKRSTYRAGVLVFRLFCAKDPKAIYGWSREISLLRKQYAAYGLHVLGEYKLLCDLLRERQYQQFDEMLEALREKYDREPEFMTDENCAFGALTAEHSW
jgi:hypothetical protein